MVKDLSLPGLKLIELKIYKDDRGFFTERYVQERFKEFGLPGNFVQDNHSRSKPGVIRGLHYQTNSAQGKLVGAIRGRILDVVVDIRKSSPTFGKWEAVELSDENGRLLWVPAGFAHGFCVLGNEDADVSIRSMRRIPRKQKGALFIMIQASKLSGR
jgi:dTDP-4-dehydrorhamnose 3,5-epimerase